MMLGFSGSSGRFTGRTTFARGAGRRLSGSAFAGAAVAAGRTKSTRPVSPLRRANCTPFTTCVASTAASSAETIHSWDESDEAGGAFFPLSFSAATGCGAGGADSIAGGGEGRAAGAAFLCGALPRDALLRGRGAALRPPAVFFLPDSAPGRPFSPSAIITHSVALRFRSPNPTHSFHSGLGLQPPTRAIPARR